MQECLNVLLLAAFKERLSKLTGIFLYDFSANKEVTRLKL